MNIGKIKAIVAIVVATILYGFEWFFVTKLDRMGMSAFAITFGIVFFALIGLIIIARIKKIKLLPKDKNDLKNLIWLGLFYSVSAVLFFAALAKGKVASVLLLNFLAPIWTVFLAKIFLGEKITRNKLFSLGLAVLGLLIAFNIFSNKSGWQANQFVIVNLFALLAGFFAAGKTIISSKTKHLSEYMRSYWMFLLSSLIMLTINILYPSKFSTDSWFLIIFYFLCLGIGIQLISVLLIQYAFKCLEASVIGILLLLEIATGVIIAWLIGGQEQVPSVSMILGGGLIILACINLIMHKEADNDSKKDSIKDGTMDNFKNDIG